MPERVYNLSYSTATKTLLVSMAHRHVYVYNLPDLISAGGDNAKPQFERESALKFLTRSVACMADGKGTSCVAGYCLWLCIGRKLISDVQAGHQDQSKGE